MNTLEGLSKSCSAFAPDIIVNRNDFYYFFPFFGQLLQGNIQHRGQLRTEWDRGRFPVPQLPEPTPTPDLPGTPNWPFNPIGGGDELEPIIVGPITPIDPPWPPVVTESTGSEPEDDIGELQTVTRTHTYTYGNSDWADLLTAYDGNPITYDAIGNPTTWYDGAAMTWTNGRRLATMQSRVGYIQTIHGR